MLHRSGLDPYICDNNSNSDNTECTDIVGDISQEDISGSSDSSGNATAEDKVENTEPPLLKPPKFQKGVLRTNCIDCLDRTNVAQYAYGLAALGYQLHALGSIESPELGLEAPLAHHLMHLYERMGDTLAVQYSGSAAHNKVICGMFFWLYWQQSADPGLELSIHVFFLKRAFNPCLLISLSPV